MKCADPTLCYNDHQGKRIFRSFSYFSWKKCLLPQNHIVFDCGRCLFCRKKKSTELAMKCVLHSSLYTHNCFLTLTYDEKKEGYHNEFELPDIQKFQKNFRQTWWRNYHKRIEIFRVHEYGKNGKKHWHAVVFNADFPDKKFFTQKNGNSLYTSEILSRLWKHGNHTIGGVSEASAMYQAQYMEKDTRNGNNDANGRRSKSHHRGIGVPYFLRHYRQILTLGYIPFGLRKMPVPRTFTKIAHRHFAHYYEPSLFFDTKERKRRYTPFKIGQENKEIADLYLVYRSIKQEHISQIESEWNEVISQYLTTDHDPDFLKAHNNAMYDLRKKSNERF